MDDFDSPGRSQFRGPCHRLGNSIGTYAGILRALPLIAVLIVSLALVPPAFAQEELVVLTWSEYLDPDLAEEFEKKSGIKIRFTYFETDDDRNRILAEHDGTGFDVVLVNGSNIAPYVRRGWLKTLDEASIPNLRHIEPRWRDAFPHAREFGVPYFWGTLGIAYRKDLFPDGFKSWNDLFEPAEALRGRIVMIKTNREVFGMALKGLGHSMNSQDHDALRAVEKLIEGQLPFVRAYSYVALNEESALVTGDAWAAMVYNGDAIALNEIDENIAYVIPTEGTNLWSDYLAILNSAMNPTGAARFIDFLNRPTVAARNAEYMYFATPNRAAEAQLPRDFLDNPDIYPGKDEMARSEALGTVSPRTLKRINTFMNRIVQ